MKKTPLLLAGAALLALASAPVSAAEKVYMVSAGEAVNVQTHTSVRPGDLPDQRITTRVTTTESEPVYRQVPAPGAYAHHPIGHPNAKDGFATTETTSWSKDVVQTPNGRVTTYTKTRNGDPTIIEPALGDRKTVIIKRQ